MIKNPDTPLIITFMGPVGVGKTTQIRLLRKYFKLTNRNSVHTYIKSAHGLCYLLLLLFRILGISKKVNSFNGKVNYRLPRNFQKRIMPLWNLSDTISIIGKFFFTVYLPHLLGYNIIIEEGIQMTILHYKLFRPHFLGVKSRQLPLLDVLLSWKNSQKNLDIVLDAKEPEIIDRRKTRSFRKYESQEFVELQRKAMSALSASNRLYIDTSGRSILSVHKRILAQIEGQ